MHLRRVGPGKKVERESGRDERKRDALLKWVVIIFHGPNQCRINWFYEDFIVKSSYRQIIKL